MIDQALAFADGLGLDLFTTNRQSEPFARLQVDGHHENWPLLSDTFRAWLERELFLRHGELPASSVVASILRQLKAIARFCGRKHPIYLRVAGNADKLYVDLANERWQVVEISVDGWQVLNDSLVLFRRPTGMQPLPTPARGGIVQELLRFVNPGTRDQQLLFLVWLLNAFRPTGPYPVLALNGPQGSAKSTCQKVLRSLVDPADSPLRTAPQDERDLMISAKHGHLVGLDNVSSIPAWLSDALCRLATGGGLATRQLFSDQKQVLFEATRPIIVSSIEDLAQRGDLLDRLVKLRLPPIPDNARKTEAEFWNQFESAKPRIFGALLDALSQVLRRIKTVHVENLPRMADFALWGVAAEEVLGFKNGDFIIAYEHNRQENSYHALESSPAATAVVNLVRQCNTWQGTHGELLVTLNSTSTQRRDPQWPKSARAMAAVLSRVEPDLLVAGIKCTRLQRQGGTGARRIRIEFVTGSQAAPEAAATPVSDDVTIQGCEPFAQDLELPAKEAAQSIQGELFPAEATQSSLPPIAAQKITSANNLKGSNRHAA